MTPTLCHSKPSHQTHIHKQAHLGPWSL